MNTKHRVYKLNLNKFGTFCMGVCALVLMAWVWIAILLGLAEM